MAFYRPVYRQDLQFVLVLFWLHLSSALSLFFSPRPGLLTLFSRSSPIFPGLPMFIRSPQSHPPSSYERTPRRHSREVQHPGGGERPRPERGAEAAPQHRAGAGAEAGAGGGYRGTGAPGMASKPLEPSVGWPHNKSICRIFMF